MRLRKKHFIAALGLAAVAITFQSLRPDDPLSSNTTPTQSAIDDYEQHPPQALDFWVQKLQQPLQTGENVRMLIQYDVTEPLPPTLTIYNGPQNSVTFYDDGTNGDDNAHDHIYAGYIKEDLNDFTKQIASNLQELKLKGELIEFHGHNGIKINTGGINFDFPNFDDYQVVRLDAHLMAITHCIWDLKRENSLLITERKVVEDIARTVYGTTPGYRGNPEGAWAFSHLMKEMTSSSPDATKALLKTLISHWTHNVVLNGQTVSARPDVFTFLIGPWINKARGSASISTIPINVGNWETEWDATTEESLLNWAPFKLTAISNRIDVRGNPSYAAGISNAGETRFIFTLINLYNRDGSAIGHKPIHKGQVGTFDATTAFMDWEGMNIILEYGNVQTTLCQARDFANSWCALSDTAVGCEEYNRRLQLITETVTEANAAPSKSHGSAINRIRTNERIFQPALASDENSWPPSDWEFRQFELDGSGFHQVPLTNTPINAANDANGLNITGTTIIPEDPSEQDRLLNYMFSNPIISNRIKNGTHTLPPNYPDGRPLLSAAGRVSGEQFHYWDMNWSAVLTNYTPALTSTGELVTNVNHKEMRHQLSLNTCQGCHNGETKTLFTMVRPLDYNEEAKYWVNTTTPDRLLINRTIDKRFVSHPGRDEDLYDGLGYREKVSPFLTGRRYSTDPVTLAGTYNDDFNADGDDETMNGLFYVNSPDMNSNGFLNLPPYDQKYGYNDLLRRLTDLCTLANSECRPFRVSDVVSGVQFIAFPKGGH